jgi:Effector Associated Constant Component 1
MDVEISAEVSGQADETELHSLFTWLQQERPGPGRVALTTRVLAETVQVALGGGGTGAVLAGSVTRWIKTRRQPVSLRLRRRDGEELAIDANVKNPEA